MHEMPDIFILGGRQTDLLDFGAGILCKTGWQLQTALTLCMFVKGLAWPFGSGGAEHLLLQLMSSPPVNSKPLLFLNQIVITCMKAYKYSLYCCIHIHLQYNPR